MLMRVIRLAGVVLLAAALCAAQTGYYGLGTGGEPPADFHGKVRSTTGKKLLIDMAEDQTLEFYYSKKTKFYDGDKKLEASSLKPGDRVSVEAQRGLDGTLNAVKVRLEHSGS
jgi:hypothetical protein